MDRRLSFQTLLESLLGSGNVYFQPPDNLQMSYPAIVYNLSNVDVKRADNSVYAHRAGYDVKYISRSPVGDIKTQLLKLPMSSFVREYVVSGLNHTVYRIYF